VSKKKKRATVELVVCRLCGLPRSHGLCCSHDVTPPTEPEPGAVAFARMLERGYRPQWFDVWMAGQQPREDR